MITTIEVKSFGMAAEGARRRCESGPAENVVISLSVALPACDDSFLRTYIDEAQLWQARGRPPSLHFSHGEFMHSAGDPLEFLVNELRRKPTGNRACVVLADNKTIAESGDGLLPSFMLLQVGRAFNNPSVLMLTAYFRALEVSEFLPINLAELALIADGIQLAIPEFTTASIVIHAFRAHELKDFRRHTRGALDIASNTQLQELVSQGDTATLAEWMHEKAQPETIIEVGGIVRLATLAPSAGWDSQTVDSIDKAVIALTKLAVARQSATHGATLAGLQADASEAFRRAATLLDAESGAS